MESVEVFWEVETRVNFNFKCWARLPCADGESTRFDRESDARAVFDEWRRRTGREARLVRVTREVVEPG
jgi:hypothetical protein